MAGNPAKSEKTAEEQALERRQRTMLDEEIAETEQQLKSLARGTLGRKSLLTGAPTTPAQAASRGKPSMIPGNSSGINASSQSGSGTRSAAAGGARTAAGGGVVR